MSECPLSQLELFRGADYQTSIDGSYWSSILPTGDCDKSTLTFDLKSVEEYTDPSSFQLRLKCGIRKPDSADNTKTKPIDDKDEIGPVDGLFDSLFSQIIVF